MAMCQPGDVIVAVEEAIAVGVVVVSISQVAPCAESCRRQVRALGVPHIIVVRARSALVATPIVNVAPVVEAFGVDREQVEDREELTAECTMEGAIVDAGGVFGVVVPEAHARCLSCGPPRPKSHRGPRRERAIRPHRRPRR